MSNFSSSEGEVICPSVAELVERILSAALRVIAPELKLAVVVPEAEEARESSFTAVDEVDKNVIADM